MSLEKLGPVCSNDVETTINSASLSASPENTYQLNTVYFQPHVGDRTLLYSGATNTSAVSLSEDSRNFQMIYVVFEEPRLQAIPVEPYNAEYSANATKVQHFGNWSNNRYNWWHQLYWDSPSAFHVSRRQILTYWTNNNNVPSLWSVETGNKTGHLNSIKMVYGFNRISGGVNG